MNHTGVLRPGRWEFWFLNAIVLLLPVAALNMFAPFDSLALFDALFLPLLAAFAWRKAGSAGRLLAPTPLRLPLFVLLVGALVATVFASDIPASVYGILIFLRFYLFYRVALDLVESKRQLQVVLILLATGAVASVGLGIAQGMLGLNITFGEELNQNSATLIGGQIVLRTVGTFSNALNYANYVSVTLFTIAILSLSGQRNRRLLVVGLAVLSVVALLQTLSRGPILACAIGGLVYWGADMRRGKVVQLVLGIMFVATLSVTPVFGSGLAQRLLGENLFVRFASVIERFDLNIRYTLWGEAARNWDDHLVGVGLRNSDYRVQWPGVSIEGYYPYETRGWKPFNFHFENVYVAMYMNLGLLGLAGFLLLLARTVLGPFLAVRREGDETLRRSARVLLACQVTFAFNMVTNPAILSDLRIMLLFWLLLACIAALPKLMSPTDHAVQPAVA